MHVVVRCSAVLGFVVAVTLPAKAQAQAQAAALGVVIDSIHSGGLADAVILVEGTTLSRMSNAAGEFRFDSLPPGTRRFLLRHPLVDSIGLEIVSAPIELAAGRIALIALAVPSPRTLRHLLCLARDTTDGKAMIRGRVSDPDTDSAIVDARVSFLYYELRVSGDSGIKRMERLRETKTKRDGTYSICGLPENVAGTLLAVYGRTTTPEVPIKRGMDEIVFRNLLISRERVASLAVARPDSSAVVALVDSTLVPTGQGHAVLEGRAIGPDSVGISDVQVAVGGTSQLAYTRVDGSFVIEGLPSGTSEVFARKIGYTPARAIVDLTAREPKRVTLLLERAATLAPVKVVATMQQRLQRVGFLDRKRMGHGRFIDAEEIARRNPMQVTDILRSFPGFRIVESEFGRRIVPTRSVSGQSGYCLNLFVDNARWEMNDPGDLDRAFQVHEIAAVETYAGDFVPQQFIVPTKYCPTIVIWTKTRLDEK